MTKRGMKVFILIMVGLFIAACSISKEPAEKTIKSAENVFNAIKEEALKYATVETREVEKAILTAKDKYDRNEYDAAFKAATALPDKVNYLTTLAATRKIEWMKNWESISKDLPPMLDALQARIEELSQRKKLPPGMDKAKLDDARAAQTLVTQIWTEAKDTYAAGNLIDAVTKAKTAMGKMAEAMTGLGMQVKEVSIN
ncbi:MAG: hypothetical protein NTV99_04720 [Deltaproteobacteria bacterium]|nr:hypothetical protein [Deltaproteobacteria bacterium]